MIEEKSDYVIRLPEVLKRVGLRRPTLYKRIKLGTFPKPIKLGERASGWLNSEITEWLQKRIDERDSR